MYPPGVSSSGEYGLPAAARYGRNQGAGGNGYSGAGRPTSMAPDHGLGDTTSSDTTPSSADQVLMTPTTGHSVSPGHPSPIVMVTPPGAHGSPHAHTGLSGESVSDTIGAPVHSAKR